MMKNSISQNLHQFIFVN